MSEGRELIAGFNQAATWFTEVLCGAGDGVMVTGISMPVTFDPLPDQSVGDSGGFMEEEDQGNVRCAGNLNAFMRYDGLDVLIACIMGLTSTPVQASGAAYDNYFKMDENVDGLFGTLVQDKGGTSVHEHPSVKLTGLTIRGASGNPLEVVFDAIANNMNTNVDSGTNYNDTISTVALPTGGQDNRVLFRQGDFLVNDATGDALAPGTDDIYPASFEISLRRPITENFVANANNSDETSEPTGDGFPEVMVTITFAEYVNDTHIDKLLGGTKRKALFEFTGGEILTGHNREFKMYFPNLMPRTAPSDMTGPGKIPHSLTFHALGTATQRTGMDGIYEPCYFYIKNQRTTAPLD